VRAHSLAALTLLSACRGSPDSPASSRPRDIPNVPPPARSTDTGKREEHALLPPLPPGTDERDVKVVRIAADNHYELDGKELGDASDLARSGTLKKLEPLSNALNESRSDWHLKHPSERFAGVLIVDADDNVAAIVVKAVVQTAAFAGYPNVSFRVKTPP
jgi:hypothetical protein